MTDLEKHIKLEALITQREAFIWANKQREHLGNSMAYDEEAFFELQDDILKLSEVSHG